MAFTTDATIGSFGGRMLKLSHDAESTGCRMKLNMFVPGGASAAKPVPVLFYLAGLTCTGDNGAEKGGFQAAAARRGIAVVFPDTSPRGLGLAGEDDAYDFGSGAGFYVDATAEPWAGRYRMESYIARELPDSLFREFKELDGSRVSVCGHSMGGHGALTLFLKHPGKYRSVSAFSPISNPLKAPWGEKAFKGYFGEERWQDEGRRHDATELVLAAGGATKKPDFPCLVDVGTADNFYKQGQLLPENLQAAADKAGLAGGLQVRLHDGYDHSYYFISTFSGDHVDHAAKHLFA